MKLLERVLVFLSIVALAVYVFSKEKKSKFRPLKSYKIHEIQKKYDRSKEPFTSIVDSHVHFRPFGGEEIPFDEVLDYFRKTNVRFVNVYGIGQRVPIDSDCTYYLDCPDVPVLPTIKNDFLNAETFIKNTPDDIHLTLSMTFPDLSNPEEIIKKMNLLEKEYPGVFRWMGEVNLIKQALLNNQHQPANIENIHQWAAFMNELERRNIPINIHSDLGNNEEPTKFLYR